MKPNAKGNLQREAGTPARNYIKRQLRMFPILKLVTVHIKVTAVYLAEQHIALSNFKLSFFKAHRLGTITAAPALVKHESTMLHTQLLNYFFGFFGYFYAF